MACASTDREKNDDDILGITRPCERQLYIQVTNAAATAEKRMKRQLRHAHAASGAYGQPGRLHARGGVTSREALGGRGARVCRGPMMTWHCGEQPQNAMVFVSVFGLPGGALPRARPCGPQPSIRAPSVRRVTRPPARPRAPEAAWRACPRSSRATRLLPLPARRPRAHAASTPCRASTMDGPHDGAAPVASSAERLNECVSHAPT